MGQPKESTKARADPTGEDLEHPASVVDMNHRRGHLDPVDAADVRRTSAQVEADIERGDGDRVVEILSFHVTDSSEGRVA